MCRQEAEAIDLAKLPANASYQQHQPLLPPSLEPLEYARNDIIYMRDLGQGAFGRVFQVSSAQWWNIEGRAYREPVLHL